MNAAALGQVSGNAAEIYERFFVPALFGEWAVPLLDAARIGPGQTVLDVACGTGVVAREARQRVGDAGAVEGVDCNAAMLAEARRHDASTNWRLGRAEELPCADDSFDAVLCQFGLMFFEDRVAALREMRRVLRPGGRMAVAVWAGLDATPGFASLVALLERLFGSTVADVLRRPFCLGDKNEFAALFTAAGCSDCTIQTRTGTARFPSIRSWINTNVKGWTFADQIDDAGLEELMAAAEREFQHLLADDGSVVFAAPAHIATAQRS